MINLKGNLHSEDKKMSICKPFCFLCSEKGADCTCGQREVLE
jgi:hypothetical protein